MSKPFSSYRPEVHGHRGCRGLRPENTLPAFLHALSLGVDVLEMDVIISADMQVVVSHEPWLNPKFCLGPTGEIIPPEEGPVHNLYRMPYAAIQGCECGLKPHPDYQEQVPMSAYKPLLREALAATEAACRELGRPPVGYSIEIKSAQAWDHIFHPNPAQFLALVLGDLTRLEVLSRTTLLCFDKRILRLAHQTMPALSTCYLVEGPIPWAQSMQQLGFVPNTFGPDFRTMTHAQFQDVRTTYPSLRVVPWTVNETVDMQLMLSLGVNGITTDYPNRLLALLQ